ncbi:hypothetical protein VF14_32875 [Nostoc linckia z18]|jgi:hypothetical protein|uniref:Secreted protein n=3 Tax=Nostoc TaxID=1177 RepID=A0A9Q6EJV4_NOSLI|nr:MULTISPECIES: hypothetical protein [Nostoc]MBL1202329.1 hypothetical protein [Nostoc sp. GBBB01]MDZ8012672.1 hypothetical protein [Nostoc sp. ZfuVER08]PHK27333.1 hypothetical protein VF12_35125 [Nostoc linckia z15]PHK45687.1 hypothetical protein VF13_15035 [Nostoc linckia z16]MBC1238326.1 hypothetical protein [Nostoc sp. 2RC]
MNRKLILNLLSTSTIFASLMSTLGIFHPAHASITQRLMHTQDGRTCITNPHGGKDFICIRDSERKQPYTSKQRSTTVVTSVSDENIAMLDFTEEESEAAIKLFACDCPYCINSLRQLRGTGNLVY